MNTYKITNRMNPFKNETNLIIFFGINLDNDEYTSIQNTLVNQNISNDIVKNLHITLNEIIINKLHPNVKNISDLQLKNIIRNSFQQNFGKYLLNNVILYPKSILSGYKIMGN